MSEKKIVIEKKGDAQTHCPLCGLGNKIVHVRRYSRDEWRILECTACSFTFLGNPPEYSLLADALAWEKTLPKERQRRREKSPLHAALSKVLSRAKGPYRMDSLALKYFAAGEILDVGCGNGYKLARLIGTLKDRRDVVATPLGLEISEALAAEANARLKPLGGAVRCGPAIEGLEQLEPSRFSGVYMDSYLEHERDPVAALRLVRRVLAPNCHVVIKVPNYGSVNRMVTQTNWCGFRYPDHVSYFTPRTLVKIATLPGLTVRQMTFRDRLPTSDNMYIVLQRLD